MSAIKYAFPKFEFKSFVFEKIHTNHECLPEIDPSNLWKNVNKAAFSYTQTISYLILSNFYSDLIKIETTLE